MTECSNSKCGKMKSLDSFCINKKTKDGRSSWCRDCTNAAIRKWQEQHPEKVKAASIRWEKADEERTRQKRKRAYDKRANTPEGKLNSRVSVSMRNCLCGKKNWRSWESLVGYNAEQLKKHLEKQFTDGMTWERFIKGEIHIDHRIPLCVFNFETTNSIDFKIAWALDNLQPLWAMDNFIKNAKFCS